MRRSLSVCRDLWHDRSGAAALEFAVVGSTLVTLILGTVEVSNAIRLQAKVEVTAGQLAEFVAGQLSVVSGQWSATAASGTLADLCNGAAMNLAPYPVGALSADVVSLTNDRPSNRETVSRWSWSCRCYINMPSSDTKTRTYLDWESTSTCATTVSSALTLQSAFNLANKPTSLLSKTGTPAKDTSDNENLKYGYSAIVVKAQYSYTNFVTFFLGKKINFSAVATARPRSNTMITCKNTDGTSC